MNIPAIIAQNLNNKLRNEEIQDEARASFVNYTARLYYNNTINNYKQVCEKIYGKLPYLTDSKFGELFTKLQNIMESTGIKIEKMISDIKNYLGYNATMQRLVDGKRVTIDPICIEETWKSVVSNKGIVQVENILYFN